jgi:hypothetical protein
MENEDRAEESKAHEVFIDFRNKSDEELKQILEELLKEERRISYQRRILHGKIDLLRAELVRRRREGIRKGTFVISDQEIRRLSEILAGEAVGLGGKDPLIPEG